MANEITRDAQATFIEMERMMIIEARARTVALPTCRQDSVEGVPTMAKSYPKHPTTADAGAITDGTALSNTGIDATSVTITAAGVGLKADLTDQSATGSLLDLEESSQNFARALANKIEVDITALYDGFSTSVGTSGSDLTVAQFLSAIYELELANEDNNLVSVMHPIQAHDLRTAIVAASGAIYSNPSEFTGGFTNAQQQALKGTLFGVPVFTSSNCESLNTNADRGGAVYSAGRALGFLWNWRPRVEFIRYPALPGWSLAVTSCYGVAELVDGAGVAIITDHE